MRPETKVLADGLVETVKGYVRQLHDALTGRMELLEKRLSELPVPKDGEPGKEGPPGKDAPAVDEAVIVKNVLAAIPLPVDGKDGADGAPGADGKSVSAEEVAALVEQAVQKAVAALPVAKDGADGRDGKDGAPGIDGAPGRDAAHIEILPAIDSEKTYPRGTYAKHAGGLWRSYETTAGMKGWECIVEGVPFVLVENHPEDPRKFFVNIATSSGAETVKEFSLPAMIYRGIFSEGQEYARGDTVTWAGSLWHCNEPTQEKPIDGSKFWQLAAKRGRDGKSA